MPYLSGMGTGVKSEFLNKLRDKREEETGKRFDELIVSDPRFRYQVEIDPCRQEKARCLYSTPNEVFQREHDRDAGVRELIKKECGRFSGYDNYLDNSSQNDRLCSLAQIMDDIFSSHEITRVSIKSGKRSVVYRMILEEDWVIYISVENEDALARVREGALALRFSVSNVGGEICQKLLSGMPLFKLSELVPGFSGAYFMFEKLSEAALIVSAYAELLRLTAPYIQQVLANRSNKRRSNSGIDGVRVI